MTATNKVKAMVSGDMFKHIPTSTCNCPNYAS